MSMFPCMPRRVLPRRPRRGVALFVVLMFVVIVAVLALAAIVTTGNASLVAKSHARENDLRYSAEAALAIGKSRLNFDAAALPDTGYVVLMDDAELAAADGAPIPGVRVTVYAGPSGSTSGQFGRFASVVAEARDNQGNGFIRRLELSQESFAKYAYWSDEETSGSGTIYFGGGDQLWGPVWSNDDISIASSGATFNDAVATAGTISGRNYGTFRKGYRENQKPIELPTTSELETQLLGFADAAGWRFTSPTFSGASTIRMRIEFVALDLNADGDSIDANEGFFKVYRGNSGTSGWVRADWPGSTPVATDLYTCGDFHNGKFYPARVHPNTWFRDTLDNHPGISFTTASNEMNATSETIMNKSGTRCFLGGSNELAAVARTSALGYASSQRNIGGTPYTFTPVDQFGAWTKYTDTPDAALATARAAHGDAQYLWPLSRTMNTNAKGVIYVQGSVGVSGTLRGRVTLFATGTIVILDDIRYANDPGKGVCGDMLGLLASDNIVVADNAALTPQRVKWTGTDVHRNLDDTKDLYIHGVMMALNTSFTVEDYASGPDNVNDCEGNNNGRGCLYLAGGLIQQNRGPVGLLSGEGFVKRYSYDRCAIITPPPYFPTTGRFDDNRYYELNPVGFNATALYRSLTPEP